MNALLPDLASVTAGPLGISVAAWVLVPLALFVIGLGVGLLVERISAVPLPTAVLVPVGICTAVALVMPGYRLGAGGWLAVAVLAPATAAGLLAGRHGLRARARGDKPALLAAAGVYGMYLAPVLLAGGWTWTGYNFVNDTAVQFLLADHLANTGTSMPLGPPDAAPQSTALEHIRIYLVTAYPLGLHGLLATLTTALRIPIEIMYQPVIGGLAGMGAMAMTALIRPAVGSARWAGGIAGVAMTANLTYSYGLQGNAKEIGVLSAVVVAAAAGRIALTADRPAAAIAVTALPVAAALAFFSAAAVPFAGCLALALLVAAFVQRSATLKRRLPQSAVLGTAVLCLAAAATLVKIVRFGEVAKGTFSASSPVADLGQLVRPLPLSEAAGVWLGGDYRLAVTGVWGTATEVIAIVVAILLTGGALGTLLRRETGLLLLLTSVGLTLLVVEPRVSPYAAGKLIAIAAPAVVAGAGVGCMLLAQRWRPAGYAAAGLVAAGVMASNALAYHDVRLAPADRMEAMRDIGRHYKDAGPVLVDDMDEFAKYFMRPAKMNVALELITPQPARDRLSTQFMPRHADLDQMTLEYLAQFPVIVQRRGPDASRAPSNYKLDYQNEWYRAWKRTRPARSITRHVPFQGPFAGSLDAPCDALRELKSTAAPGARFLASLPAATVELDAVSSSHSPGWRPDAEIPRTLAPREPGRIAGDRSFEGGRYAIWVAGSSGRALDVLVDGRRVGTARGVNTNGEWLRAGAATIKRGRHRVELVRPRADLAPGDGYAGVIGPVVFEDLARPARLRAVEDPTQLCGRRLDWIETLDSAVAP